MAVLATKSTLGGAALLSAQLSSLPAGALDGGGSPKFTVIKLNDLLHSRSEEH